MPIRVLVTRDYDHMSEAAFGVLAADIRRTAPEPRDYVMGLATGNSPVGLYHHLAHAANNGAFDPGRVRSFNLDEYVGLPGADPQARTMHSASYCFFMVSRLFGLLQHAFKETAVPGANLIDQRLLQDEMKKHPADWRYLGSDSGRAVAISPKTASPYLAWVRHEILNGYAARIKRAGGIDLQIIGVGGRGHVAFHESGIPFNAGQVLLVKLDDNTVANAVADGHFGDAADVPRFAVSMGASLVYRARTVLLLACGERKVEPVYRSLLDAPSKEVPISHGQNYAAAGGNLIYVVDATVGAALLRERRKLRTRGVTITDLSGRGAKTTVDALPLQNYNAC